MPRSTIAKRNSLLFDKYLELRNHQLAAIAAATTENPVAFIAGTQEKYTCAVFCQAYTGYTLDINEWQVIVEISTSLAGTYRQIGVAKLPPSSEVQIPLSGMHAESVLAGASFIRARTVRVGAPGALTYGAYISTESC
jgi:hypothetical protein